MPNSVAVRHFAVGMMICCCFGLWLVSDAADGTAPVKTKGKKNPQFVQPKVLAPLLKSKSEELWDKGISKVTSDAMQDDQILGLIIQFVNRESKAGHFTLPLGRAIGFLGQAKQPQALEALTPLLKSDDFRIAMVTAEAASASTKQELLEPIIQLADRPEFNQHYGFRRSVVEAVSRFKEKAAIDFLVKRIGTTDGQIKFEIASNLQRVTGKEFGGKAADWQKWWTASRNEFEFTRQAAADSVYLTEAPKPIPWDEPRPRFYGMTIYAKRVVFVIDRSGSMRAEVNGVSRLQRAQYELQNAIQSLTESDSFNIVAFDHEMDVFSRRLMPATEANKIEGLRFAFALTPRGDTACYEPLKMALEASNELEQIMFVSDGEPTSGALVEPDAIVIAISNLNLTQKTTITTMGIDARGSHESFLRNLSHKNYGRMLLVR